MKVWWGLNGAIRSPFKTPVEQERKRPFPCLWNLHSHFLSHVSFCLTCPYMFPRSPLYLCLGFLFPSILSYPRFSGPGNKPDRRRKHIFMSVVFLYNYTLNCWVEKSKCPHPSRAGYLNWILHSLMSCILWRLFLFPEAELGHPLFSSPCYGRSWRQLFPSIIPGILLLSFLHSLSPLLCFSLSSCNCVTASHACKRGVNVLVKGLACMSWTLLMRTGRCGEQPTISKLMWNVPVLIGFRLQLSQPLQHKPGIMEKTNKPSG